MHNALKYRELWMESFFIQSLILAFATLFEEGQRVRFLNDIKSKILSALPIPGLSASQCIVTPSKPSLKASSP